MRFFLPLTKIAVSLIILPNIDAARGVALDPIGLYLTKNGYGAAYLVHPSNYYYLPIHVGGNPGQLMVDSGSPRSLIFRSSLKALNLTESKTATHVAGTFGQGADVLGVTTIRQLDAGSCVLTNVAADVASGSAPDLFGRGNASGLLGLRELIKFGAILDLHNRLLYLRTGPSSKGVSAEIASILSKQGYDRIPLLLPGYHLFIAGSLNGVKCLFLIDTGASFTTLSPDFATHLYLKIQRSNFIAHGLGGSSAADMTFVSSLRVGNLEIRNGSVAVEPLDPSVFGSKTGIAGLIGAEYLSLAFGVIDFTTGTLYLHPRR